MEHELTRAGQADPHRATAGAPHRSRRARNVATNPGLHALVEAGTLTNGQAIETIETAAAMKKEYAAIAGEGEATMLHSLALLSAIQTSFETDSIQD